MSDISHKILAKDLPKGFVKHLTAMKKRLRMRYVIQKCISFSPIILAMVIIYCFLLKRPFFGLESISLILMLLTVYLFFTLKSSGYKALTFENLLFHFNRHWPALEDSSQLLLVEIDSLNVLQRIQREKTLTIYLNELSDLKESLPKVYVKNSMLSIFIILALTISFSLLLPLHWSSTEKQEFEVAEESSKAVSIADIKVSVFSPKYSEIPTQYLTHLELNVLSGSTIRWQLAFSDPSLNYQITFADGSSLPLKLNQQGYFSAETTAGISGVYKISTVDNVFSEIFTLTVKKDQAPNIRILTPKQTITAIAKNSSLSIETEVKISDDFALSKIEILASVAKGSGEAVKFRDQTFNFDKSYQGASKDLFSKVWDLKSLDMEPGDELYFTIKAWDNKEGATQLTRSETKIIRWLEDESSLVLADGVLIDFMPEYFKSQRQIIIETIELIEDSEQLSQEKFVETSELLGVAQSQLKEKYGQYLGDEVESGHLHESASTAHTEHVSEHESEHEGEHEHKAAEAEHVHESVGQGEFGVTSDDFEMQGFSIDRSGLSEELNRFGHNHGEADIGIMGKQDPKALMKRSIAFMWKAELHLMLSEPEKALPFEKEALKFLKMAKKADRIYVKRLGFEPPPVSEQRRYKGELEDILTYQREETLTHTNEEQLMLSALYQELTDFTEKPITKSRPPTLQVSGQNQQTLDQLTPGQISLLNETKEYLQNELEERPSLIESLAVIEKMLLINSFVISDCSTCIDSLKEKLWQLTALQIAQPNIKTSLYSNENELIEQYREVVRQQQ